MRYTWLDTLLIQTDQALRTVFAAQQTSARPNPAHAIAETPLDSAEKQLSAALMRVNHAGEIAAQALYHGQALTAQTTAIQHEIKRAGDEEHEHLVWCQQRVRELEDRVSVLSPLWYTGGFFMGALAGVAGDKWSLGFIIETEKQVVAHLEGHLERLPATDAKSRAIIEQMKEDEARHATVALRNGGVPLPKPIAWMMRQSAKVMTNTAFWI